MTLPKPFIIKQKTYFLNEIFVEFDIFPKKFQYCSTMKQEINLTIKSIRRTAQFVKHLLTNSDFGKLGNTRTPSEGF